MPPSPPSRSGDFQKKWTFSSSSTKRRNFGVVLLSNLLQIMRKVFLLKEHPLNSADMIWLSQIQKTGIHWNLPERHWGGGGSIKVPGRNEEYGMEHMKVKINFSPCKEKNYRIGA